MRYFAMGRDNPEGSLYNLRLGGYARLLPCLKALFTRSVGGEVRDQHNKIVMVIKDKKAYSVADLMQEEYDRELRAFLQRKGIASVHYSKL